MKKKKKDTTKDISIELNKKDSVGLFSGKYKAKEFGGKKELEEKIEEKNKQKKYSDDE